jgi:hypothetical protein
MAYEWQDPNAELVYGTRTLTEKKRARPYQFIESGTQPVAGFSGPGYYGSDFGLTTPVHTTQAINIPGVRLGAGGRGTPQQYTYNLPMYQAPAQIGSSEYMERESGLMMSPHRRAQKMAIPGATEGEFREYNVVTDPETGEISYEKREGWDAVSEEEAQRWMGSYSARAKKKWRDTAKTEALKEHTLRKQDYAKWWNEKRYAQLQDLMGQHFKNQMGAMQGLGEAERSDIMRGGKALQESALQGAMQRGMAGTTALSAMQRGAQSQTQQELARFYERQTQQRLGMQNALATQYMNVIEGRVDEYPSTYELAQIMHGAFEGGAGQQQPSSSGGQGMGMAGMALGAGLGMAAAGAAGGGAAGAGMLGCLCQIFMEGRHGDGTMDWVVRKYRDEHINERNARGYYKMSEVIVPLMRKSKLLKMFFFLFFIQPCFIWGRWYYRDEIKKRGEKLGFGGRVGWIFGPVKRFWERLCYYLGQDHPYIRWNGELV